MNGDWLFKVIPFFIAGMAVLIICGWIGLGVIAYRAIQIGPEGIGQQVGKVVKGVTEGQR